MEGGQLIEAETFADENVEACSYDVRAGNKAILGGQGNEIDLRTQALELGPGAYAGVLSLEKLNLPTNCFARLGAKRTYMYDGLILLSGAIVDPGYRGHLLFGLYNASQKKVIVRRGRKVCNVVFERLAQPATKIAISDPNLLSGNFPDDFVQKMANMEVLPWQQISEKVGSIDQVVRDIAELRKLYEDVQRPIRDLADNLKTLSQEMRALERLVSENTRQISGLIEGVVEVRTRTGLLEARAEEFGKLPAKMARLEVIGVIVTLLLGAVLGVGGKVLADLLLTVRP